MWKKGSIPHFATLFRYGKTLSDILTKKYNVGIVISPETLRDGDVRQVIEEARKKPAYKTPQDKNWFVKEVIEPREEQDRTLEYDNPADDPNFVFPGLLQLMEFREDMNITRDEFYQLKELYFRKKPGYMPDLHFYIQMLFELRKLKDRQRNTE